MAVKQIALGTVLKTDHDANAMFDNMTLVSAITPPARTREEIEGKDLGDTLDVPLLGIEAPSRPAFVQFWEPNDSEHEKIDTLFGSKATFGIQIVSPHSVAVTDEFDCKVLSLEPAELNASGVYQRTVTLLRVGDITRT
tara:strand:- start:351 stop:767 length:417 start_codon:yes stop_codon:yes gene_type:complete